MTSGIRNNWMQAIQKCMETSGRPSHLDFTSAHRDFSPVSSNSRTSAYSSPSRSSSRHSDYASPQRPTSTSSIEQTSRRHTPSVASPARSLYSSEAGILSPRSDKSESANSRLSSTDSLYSRQSRARRSTLEAYKDMEVKGASAPDSPQRSAGGRYTSCTWPYDSSSSGASSERDHTPDSQSSRSRRNSNVSQYLEVNCLGAKVYCMIF